MCIRDRLSLTFKNKTFNEETGPIISSLLRAFKLLTHINLTFNKANLTDKCLSEVIEALVSLGHLRNLDLDFGFNDSFQTSIFRAISGMKQLKELKIDLSHCREVTDETLDSLASGLRDTKLTDLVLKFEGQNFSDEAYSNLFSSLEYQGQLKFVDVSLEDNENVSKVAFSTLSRSAVGLSALVKLNLALAGCERIDDDCVQFIGLMIGSTPSIAQLELSIPNLNISDIGVIAIADGISQLLHLTNLTLFLSKTKVSDVGIGKLIDVLSSLNRLKQLELGLYGCSSITQSIATMLANLLRIRVTLLDFLIISPGLQDLLRQTIKEEELVRPFTRFIIQ
eukprot:TRINITY_DN7484_c0_g1_i2.p1 TRINITY_DN7484_c0_g1~~TRINITY_DN7484_c0_g1_i2.p1  ORF type:complete len:358 (-),score=49.03 TRINITY_DN7484_c0_g1_i2:33-1046(-)